MSNNVAVTPPPPSFEDFIGMDRVFKEIASASSKVFRLPPEKFDKNQVILAFHEAFQLIGGVPRLAMWAHENPSDFFKIYGKLLPQGATLDVSHTGEVTLKHALKSTSLDNCEDPQLLPEPRTTNE